MKIELDKLTFGDRCACGHPVGWHGTGRTEWCPDCRCYRPRRPLPPEARGVVERLQADLAALVPPEPGLCRWHPRRRAVAVGLMSRLGYCRECWPAARRLPTRLDRLPFDAAIWLAA